MKEDKLQSVSPYSIGFQSVFHRNVNVKTIFGSEEADRFIQQLVESENYRVGYVPIGYEHRPDLISDVFYNTPDNWWILMLANNIIDPFEGFNVGDEIIIPSL